MIKRIRVRRLKNNGTGPTPWKLAKYVPSPGLSREGIFDAEGGEVVYNIRATPNSDARDKANAELIVKAVNEYSDALAWLEKCKKCNSGDEMSDCPFYGEPDGCSSPMRGTHPKAAWLREEKTKNEDA